MQKKTHLLFGTGLSLYIISLFGQISQISILFIVIFSIFPDLDLKNNHRKLFHNIFALLLIPAIAVVLSYNYLIDYQLTSESEILIYLSAVISYGLHLILDMLTKMGVYLFWPLSNKSIGLKLVRTDNNLLNAVLSIIGMLLIIKVFIPL
ncbi:metal-dependent hydrolase [Fervidicoccus fontis]|jgi:inner membrane protein|uniref:Metal-dependent hydrolase n=2 Tax=Fervidicoccus fontis TaxID=683846 RepID=A0A7C2VJ93_9CREN|nr:metal-dependent hydrolase [Fervidicoccus fontis]AFH42786.1 putative membrane-bound metal dependent hydrolase [Fervidicoccus fontis Kam940]MBE9391346.1 metal-dependent hydrolase [Fervidicoccus fontis]PMB76388.1 MAG: metal-dependent hydrolase [Fervidicoccus fontis]HEW64123.1 metal-dependent hydrolase [Fervidicoccus fontis]